MAPSILIFDFGTNEEAAQQAKRKIEGWTQGFRLGKKISVKFEREESAPGAGVGDGEAEENDSALPHAATAPAKKSVTKGVATKKADAIKTGAKKPDAKKSGKVEKPEDASKILLLVQLDFSDHEKLTHQRWLDRIPTEEPFKSVSGETIRQNDPAFAKAKDRFDLLA